jgi:hypothetical protein
MTPANMRENGVRSPGSSACSATVVNVDRFVDATTVPAFGPAWSAPAVGSSALTCGQTGRSDRRLRASLVCSGDERGPVPHLGGRTKLQT